MCLDLTYISARESSRFSSVVNWCGCIKGQRRWFPSAEDTADVPFMPCPFDLQKRRKPSGSQQGTDGQRLCWGTAEFQNIYVRLLKRNGHMPKALESSQFGFCNQHATGWDLGSAHNLTWDTSTCRGLASACSLLCSVVFLHCSPTGIGTSATFSVHLCSVLSFSTTGPRDLNAPELKDAHRNTDHTALLATAAAVFQLLASDESQLQAWGWMHFNPVLCGLRISL